MNTTVVERMLAKHGRDCDLITYTTAAESDKPWRDTAFQDVQSTRGIFLRDYSEQGPDVPVGSKFLLLGSSSAPSLKGQVKVDSVLWKIRNIRVLSSGDVVIAYILTVTQ